MAITTTRRVQVDLQSGNRFRTCWVEPRVKVGNRITLRNADDPHRWWDVMRVGEHVIDVSSINRGWENDI